MKHSSSEQHTISFNYQLIYMELYLAETIIWSLHGAVNSALADSNKMS